MSRTHEWAKRWDILFNKRNKFHISKESYVLFCLLPHNNRAINCKAFHDSGENINETLFYIIIVFICTCNKWELELIKINETLRCISILYKWSLFAPPRPALPDLLYFFLRGGEGGGGGGEKRSDHIKRWAIMPIIMLGIRFNVVFLYSSY